MIMAPRGMLTPMPTLAESERLDDDAGIEVDELAAVLVDLSDASAADEGLEMDAAEPVAVLESRDPEVVDVEGWEDTIVSCPSVRRLLGSLQQVVWVPQHQVPEESGGHATSKAPWLSEPRFA